MCIVSGQGTVGLEFLEQVPELDVIVVPIGGKHPYLQIVLRISGMSTLKISILNRETNGSQTESLSVNN
jgi:threonine dehydratase